MKADIQTAIYTFLHPVFTLMILQQSHLGLPQDLVETALKTFFLNNRLDEYKDYLTDQGYSAGLVNQEFSRAAKIPRSYLLKPKVRNYKKISFRSYLQSKFTLYQQLDFHLLESFPTLKELFPPNSIMSSYHRSKNLKEILQKEEST